VKLLFLTYFFPPAGGPGAHRPLKLAGHLAELGVETHVLAPADPRWIHEDAELRVPPGVRVHRAPYVGPRTRVRMAEVHGRRGLSRAAAEASLLGARLLLPDQHVLWNVAAIPRAVSIARREGPDAIVTTSPPSSVHLLGAAVKNVTGVRWIADLRDPVVGHPHRRLELRAVRAKERAELAVLRLVGRSADAVVAGSEGIARGVGEVSPRTRVVTIPNGCDFEEFDGLTYERGERFRITHTGTFFGRRDPRPFLSAVAGARLDVTVRLVGGCRPADREWAARLDLADRLEVIDYVPRRRALALQRDSDALLLLIPDADGRGDGVLSAKLFEYLAAERPILAAVPPHGEAAALIREAEAGVVVPPDDVGALREALERLEARWRDDELDGVPLEAGLRERLSRRQRAVELADLVRSLG
jgi:glycosyltransferase involved in cell wall biosynthesis